MARIRLPSRSRLRSSGRKNRSTVDGLPGKAGDVGVVVHDSNRGRATSDMGQSETNDTTEPWSAVEWIADDGIVLLGFGSTLPKSAQCVPSSRPSNSMLGLRQTTP